MQLAGWIKLDPAIAATQLMMLSSIADAGDSRMYAEHGIERFLVKPVRQSELYLAMVDV